jgi:inosine-uridine nucleoside N-ribohydrolase
MAAKANNPITILSIGTSTNIAQAIELAKELGIFEGFASGIKMIYKGGGAVGEVQNGQLTNTNIPGNLSIPGLFSSNNKTAAWNIYANAQAAATLFTSGLHVTQIPVNLSDEVDITENSYNTLKASAKTRAAQFVVSDIISNVNDQGGFGKEELDYWDPSVVVAALNPSFVANKFELVQICVDTNQGVTHGTTFVNSPSGQTTKCGQLNLNTGNITVYTSIDTNMFYEDFITVLNK